MPPIKPIRASSKILQGFVPASSPQLPQGLLHIVMSPKDDGGRWTVKQALMRLSNPWLSLVGEQLETPDGQTLDYWRIERADSAIIVPLWRQQLILAPATYRPGIGEVTLDFPGGRVPASQTPIEAARTILQRELHIKTDAIGTPTSINRTGWPINSSLSDQRLFGFWIQLRDELDLTEHSDFVSFPFTRAGISRLLQVLPCLQCRSVLMALTLQRHLEP